MENNMNGVTVLKSIRLLAIANALWLIPSIIYPLYKIFHFFDLSNISYQILRFLTSISAFTVTIMAAIVAKPVIKYTKKNTDGEAVFNNQTVPVAGISMACMLSIIAVIALAIRNEDLLTGALIWFMYILAAGFVIDVDVSTPIRSVLIYSIVPTFIFMLGAISLLMLDILIRGDNVIDGLNAISGVAVRHGRNYYIRLSIIYFIMFLLTVPAISFACLARSKVIQLYGASKSISVTELAQLRKKINIIATIAAVIIGVLLAT